MYEQQLENLIKPIITIFELMIHEYKKRLELKIIR